MKKTKLTTLILLTLTFALSSTTAFAGFNNQNDDNGYQGTNKYSNILPEQSNVPPPAGLLEDFFGAPYHVTDGCRADGPDILIFEEGPLGHVWGGPCCKGPELGTLNGDTFYAPNQCCNPPDLLYPQEEYTPGNHCLCFVMRFDLSQLPV